MSGPTAGNVLHGSFAEMDYPGSVCPYLIHLGTELYGSMCAAFRHGRTTYNDNMHTGFRAVLKVKKDLVI